MRIVLYGGAFMEFEKIQIAGFRNITEINIMLGSITGLLSVNSYGKSNVLKAIDFGIDFINAPKKEKDVMMGWKSGFPLNKNSYMTDFSFTIELSLVSNEKQYEAVYTYSFSWRNKTKQDAKIKKEVLKLREKGSKQLYSSYIVREDDKAFYRTSQSGRCNKEILIGDQELVLNKLTAYDNLFYLDIIMQLNDIETYIDKHLDTEKAYKPDPIIRRETQQFALVDSDNIPRTLYQLKLKYPEKYAYLEDIFTQLFPKIEYLILKELKLNASEIDCNLPEELMLMDNIYMLFCKEKNVVKPINFQNMSDGARRILLLLSNLILADIHHMPFICIEEPENSIHPGLLQQFVEVLNDIRGKTKILITSHSPYLVNYLQPEDIYIGCYNEQDLVEFHKIRESAIHRLYKDADASDMNYGDYIFDLLSDPGASEEIEQYVEK